MRNTTVIKKKRKRDSMFLIVVYFLFFAAIILGASTGCIFEDVQNRERNRIVGACAFVFACLAMYCAKCIAQHYEKTRDEQNEAT